MPADLPDRIAPKLVEHYERVKNDPRIKEYAILLPAEHEPMGVFCARISKSETFATPRNVRFGS
jgi:hypothetical protein